MTDGTWYLLLITVFGVAITLLVVTGQLSGVCLTGDEAREYLEWKETT